MRISDWSADVCSSDLGRYIHLHRYDRSLEATVSRVQLALNVSDLDQAVEFYSKLFATEPAKRKPGYANFAIAEPPLKLVLIEGEGGGTLNHLGIEVDKGQEVEAAEARPRAEGMSTTGRSEARRVGTEGGSTCRHRRAAGT